MTFLAHSEGFSWDEALFFAVPIVVLLALLWSARRGAPEVPEDDDATAMIDRPPPEQP